MDCRPVALDLALQAELEPVANALSSEAVTQETFAAIVPQLVASWQAEQRQILQSFLGRFIKSVPSNVDILDLAVSIVYTGRSVYQNVRTIRYPYILAQGFRHSKPDGDRDDFPPSHYAAPAAGPTRRRPYSLESLKPKQVEVDIKWMRSILTKLGLKPDTATLSDLEQCNACLRCLKCAEEGQGQERAYTWEAAFSHTAQHDTTQLDNAYPRSSHVRWARVGEADMIKVKEREAIAHALTADSNCQWSCVLCVDWKGCGGEGKRRIREHLASE
ncbi:hypothetical protein GSI_12723 [Ganoderma sinense ZZ0214-1]|uniref:Uncharacterized protein n=1 Tax=Ganoderma sinense ZZ0214-1 TaxID=1077348 RepID=A0A2G8RTI9_9APHY|nr:hypothetical protein GSI_12723 [Ganoderma sinense ZZ0214-1]